jgi:hypothetical protein
MGLLAGGFIMVLCTTSLADTEPYRHHPLQARLQATASGPQGRLNASPRVLLRGVDERGRPLFYRADNLDAARTVSTDRVRIGGDSGLDLTGANGPDELGMWDTGSVRATHQEFGSRISLGDGPYPMGDHSTHVAGTMIAAGLDAAAIGMSPAALLTVYDWQDDGVEMAAAAAVGLLLSNHSYSPQAGWDYVAGWYWFGDVTIDDQEDYKFGFYTPQARLWDEIAWGEPEYLIVTSAGNDRGDEGPVPGGSYYYWDPALEEWVESTDPRPRDGSDDGYDTIAGFNCAKNILTVGAVNSLPGGYADPGGVLMAGFSSWGPTDDGRIKPDLVADGSILYSVDAAADTAYSIYGGTSAAAACLSGSLNLLVQQYRALHGTALRSATLKGIAIHTAHEAGPADGPDYRFGWGLLNMLDAAQLIAQSAGDSSLIHQEVLHDGQTASWSLSSDGSEPITLTLCWTDPAATSPPPSLDPPALMLVHDLDLSLERLADGQIFRPYVLDPGDPAAAATSGDNVRDNVEKIFIDAPAAGDYRLLVSHKGSLTAPQPYSLIVSGLLPVGPSGTFVIAGGAPATNVLQVTLESMVAGAVQMRFSNDGSWSSPEADWRPYAEALGWSLAAGADGPRTVWAEYRDAGLVVLALQDQILYDTSPPPPLSDLAAARRDHDNPPGEVTAILVTWSAPEEGATVSLYRRGFGGYPEYGSGGGSEPAVPADPDAALAAGWELAGQVQGTTLVDMPPTRDFWYHVGFVTDAAGNLSAASNRTSGALDYHLGDLTSAAQPLTGDNQVGVDDVSLLAAGYGLTGGDQGFDPELDVGPTHDGSPAGRPLADDLIEFEDMILFAINFGAVGKTAPPAPRAASRLFLAAGAAPPPGQAYEVSLEMEGDGTVQGLSADLDWDPVVLSLETAAAGGLLAAQGGPHVVLSPAAGVVDVALLGPRVRGLSGTGDLVRLRFRVLAEGDPGLRLVRAQARSGQNHTVVLALDGNQELPHPPRTILLPNLPNPFNPSTTIPYEIDRSGLVLLTIYSLTGRRVRELVAAQQAAGRHEVGWDGLDAGGRLVASGTYLVRLESSGQACSRGVLLLR